jgi:hypothetical protein
MMTRRPLAIWRPFGDTLSAKQFHTLRYLWMSRTAVDIHGLSVVGHIFRAPMHIANPADIMLETLPAL